MSKVSKYTNQIQPVRKQTHTIWVESPCTISFTSKLPPLDRSERFQYNSIYYKDDPFKPAKKIDQFQKPDLLLLQFRRSIKEANKNRGIKKRTSSIRHSINKNEEYLQTSQKQKQILSRLCPKKPIRLKLQYDFHGNRSSFMLQQNQSLLKKHKKTFTNLRKYDSFFTQSQRINMARPQNFNPGPGSYFMDSLAQSIYKSRQSNHKSIKNIKKSIQKGQLQRNQTVQTFKSEQQKKRIQANDTSIN